LRLRVILILGQRRVHFGIPSSGALAFAN
jgi:hypothetical protein